MRSLILKIINVKNFHGSLLTVVRALQNDTSKTANISISLIQFWIGAFDSPYKRRRFENPWDHTFCILLLKMFCL